MSNQLEAHVFFAVWCKPCKKIKPVWNDTIKPQLKMNQVNV